MGRHLLEVGRYEEAVAPLRDAARLAPDDPGVLNDLGVACMAARRFLEAISWFRRSIALEPGVGSTHYNLGLALQHTGDDEAALIEHRRAVMLSRELAGAHAQLGDLFWERGMRSEAVAAYEQTYAAAPATTLGRLSRAKALSAEDRDREAEEELRHLIACGPSNSQAYVLLGRLLQETGRFDEAIASFENAVAVDPWQTNAYHGLVSARKVGEAERPWVARIVERLAAPDWDRRFAPAVAERHRMMLHFAAGKALDDLGDHAAAIEHFRAANQIRHELCPFDRHAVALRARAIITRFTRSFLADHAAIGRDDPTPILIVGMPRSGTTLVERMLSSHRGIRGCGELAFWSEHGPVWAGAAPEQLARASHELGEDYLRVLRRDHPGALRATDKMPFNFFWVGLVHLLLPRARFVHCRRDPVDTCLSIFTTPLPAYGGFASRPGDLASYYRQYRRLIDHWRVTLPPGRLLDVDYEELVMSPERTARRLVEFAGVDWDPACLRPEDNPDPVRTASSWQARQPVYRSSVERARRYEPWSTALRDILARP
jgi:tetratricopeptide (TPR) repeat protein